MVRTRRVSLPSTPNGHAGYLMKEASTGRWQRRWFEIVGHYLVYYKTKEDTLMLCAMDLLLVRPPPPPHLPHTRTPSSHHRTHMPTHTRTCRA